MNHEHRSPVALIHIMHLICVNACIIGLKGVKSFKTCIGRNPAVYRSCYHSTPRK
jgi:hypothetical protein